MWADYEGAEYFQGFVESADGSLIDPKLVKYVAGQLKEKAEIDKESRKAREEQEAIAARASSYRKKDPKGGGKGDPAGSHDG